MEYHQRALCNKSSESKTNLAVALSNMNDEGVVVLVPALALEALGVVAAAAGAGACLLVGRLGGRSRRRLLGTGRGGPGGGPGGSPGGGPRLEHLQEGLAPAVVALADGLSVFLSRVVGVRHAAALARDGPLDDGGGGVLVLVIWKASSYELDPIQKILANSCD